MWLVDRSRYQTGLGHCARARYLQYHAGPTGYGLVRMAESIPLATGQFVHQGLERLLKGAQGLSHADAQTILQQHLDLACVDAVQAYIDLVEARSLVAEPERVQYIMAEQALLIEGLIRCWALEVFPTLHRDYLIVAVEPEEATILTCTCGLGRRVGTIADHEARDCDGIALMSRPDVIVQHRLAGSYAYLEFKTTGEAGERFQTKWDTAIQLTSSCQALEDRYGFPIDAIYIHGLYKGYRKKGYNPLLKVYDGAPEQQSILCYGWHHPGNPPLEPPDWQPNYTWVDADGKGRRLGKGYDKRLLLRGFPMAEGQSVSQTWVEAVLSPDDRRQQLMVIGPLERRRGLSDRLLVQMEHEEERWITILSDLYSRIPSDALWEELWPTAPFQAILDELVPCSWECRRYGKDHECGYVRLCHQREGWEAPLGSGYYMLRRPHHQPELDQMVARGLAVPDAAGEEDNE